jgi:hypothetical protein
MEFDRLTVIPKASTMLNTTYLDEEEANATADGQLLTNLVGEVSEVGLDEDGYTPYMSYKHPDENPNILLTRNRGSGLNCQNLLLFPNELHVHK